jgi:replicative DNA helicase
MVQALQLNDGLRADYFSLEMNKFEIVNRIISRAESINSLKLVDYTNLRVDEKQKVIAGYRKLASQYDMALFGEELSTLGAIKRKIKQRAVNGRYICFIDYIGLINVEGVRNGGDSAGRIKMNIITRELKLLASELKIPIVMIAQLNRGLEYRQDKTPTLADLKESGSIEQDSTIVLFISRDTDDPNKAILHVGKNRVGIVGSLPFYINPSFMEFREYDQQ